MRVEPEASDLEGPSRPLRGLTARLGISTEGFLSALGVGKQEVTIRDQAVQIVRSPWGWGQIGFGFRAMASWLSDRGQVTSLSLEPQSYHL